MFIEEKFRIDVYIYRYINVIYKYLNDKIDSMYDML